MPELVEVESARSWLSQECTNATIVAVNLLESGGGPRDGLFDDIIFEHVIATEIHDALHMLCSPSSKIGVMENQDSTNNDDAETDLTLYRLALLGRKVRTIHRKGKQMWFSFYPPISSSIPYSTIVSDGVKVLFHFGMTGSFIIKGKPIPTYKTFKIETNEDTPWPPRFTKLELIFDNGTQIAFCDPRRLGRIKLRLNVEASSPVKDLALDPVLDKLPTPQELQSTLSCYSTSIKAILLDQEKLFCGIGNYLADEILYQAGIHPQTKACDINIEGCSQLLTKMHYVLVTAIAADAKYEEFPVHWLFHYRWDKGKARQKRTMPDGNEILFETHGGRTCAIVPARQPKNGYYLWSKAEQLTAKRRTPQKNEDGNLPSINVMSSLEEKDKQQEMNESRTPMILVSRKRKCDVENTKQ